RVVEEVPARAAVLDGLVSSEQALFAQPAPDLAIGHSTVIPLGDPWLDFLLDEAAYLLAEEVVLLGEDLASHDPTDPCGKVRTPEKKEARSFHGRRALSICEGREMVSDERSFDLVVIGSGPAGEKGAAQAAYFGKRVAVVERQPAFGGAAANTGT